MKSFFKKLSLVLAAAMVITMLPLQSAKAVTKVNLGVDATKAAAGETIELEVGATQKIGFYGVANYNTAGAKTKAWKSDNTSVATVSNAYVKAVAPGTANISFTCTNNGIDYAGTVKVVVIDPNAKSTISAKQTTWQTVVVTFADEAAAKAAKDGVVVERVKTSSKGTFYLNVSAKPAVKDNTLVIEPLSNGVTYRITVPGATKPFEITMNVGAPDFVDISYGTVYMSSETKTDITGESLRNPLVTPEVKVYDANGIVVQTEAKGFKFSTDKTANVGNPVFNTTKGTIRFNKLESSCYVKVVYSYKDANGKTITLDPAETTVSPVNYVAPNLQGFVEKITLVEKDAKADEIVYPSDYNYTAEIAVEQELALAFYFETPEGTKYAPDIVKSTVINSKNEKTMLNCKTNGAAYSYYVVKDDPNANFISVKQNANTVLVRGWNEGSEVLCIYERAKAGKEDTLTDKLVGVLTVEVSEEAKVVDLGLEENSLSGFINTEINDDKVGVLKYSLEDQYGKAINAYLEIKATDGKPVSGITIEDNGKAKGKIKVDYNAFGKAVEGRELEISVKNQKDEFKDYITVTADEINTSGAKGYQLVVSDRTIKNKDFV
ncbi:MAG: Ig-like domain-containing protein, partial [Lachnospiraceae bacterium]|nr:Ig-like domain-containing protein [Lachnospiraceae bacterium]